VAVGGATVVGAAVVGSALAAKKATEVAVSFDQKHEVSKQVVQGTADAGIQAMAFVVDRPNEVTRESLMMVTPKLDSQCNDLALFFAPPPSPISPQISNYHLLDTTPCTYTKTSHLSSIFCFFQFLSLSELPAVAERVVPLGAGRHESVLRRERAAHAAWGRLSGLAQDPRLQPDMAPRQPDWRAAVEVIKDMKGKERLGRCPARVLVAIFFIPKNIQQEARLVFVFFLVDFQVVASIEMPAAFFTFLLLFLCQTRLSGLVMDVDHSLDEAGARVITWSATGRNNQQFEVVCKRERECVVF